MADWIRRAEDAVYMKERFLAYMEEKGRGVLHTEEWHTKMELYRQRLLRYEINETRDTHDAYMTGFGYILVPKGTPVTMVSEEDFGRKTSLTIIPEGLPE